MADDQPTGGTTQQPPTGEPPEFLEQVIAGVVANLRQNAAGLFDAGGEQTEALVKTSARLALWLAGLRPGGLRVIRLLSGYEVELTPGDPVGFVQHLGQALVGEALTNHSAANPEEAAKALALEIANATNQITADIAPFVTRSLLWQQCGPLLQQGWDERAQEQEDATRRGSGKRSPSEVQVTPQPIVRPEGDARPPDERKATRILRPGEPEDEGPPPPLIFPGRR